jgi:hypothetical protein
MVTSPSDGQTAIDGHNSKHRGSSVEHREDHMSNGKGSAMVVVAVAFSIALWALLGTAGVEAEPEGALCSNRTLRGSYGGSFEGQIPAGPGTVLLRGLVVTHFDGAGNLRQMEFVTANGVPPPGGEWTPSEGTYEIGPDCTGVAEILQSNGTILRQRWVVVDRGREIRAVVEGAVAGGTRIKID